MRKSAGTLASPMTQTAEPTPALDPLEPEPVTGLGHAADPEALVGTVRSHTSVPSQFAGIIAVGVPPLVIALAMGLLWNTAFHVEDLVAMVVLYVLCGLGITVGWHRYFSHKSFETSNSIAGRVRVDRCHGAIVTGIHRLQHIQSFGSSAFADDDAFWTHSQSVTN